VDSQTRSPTKVRIRLFSRGIAECDCLRGLPGGCHSLHLGARVCKRLSIPRTGEVRGSTPLRSTKRNVAFVDIARGSRGSVWRLLPAPGRRRARQALVGNEAHPRWLAAHRRRAHHARRRVDPDGIERRTDIAVTSATASLAMLRATRFTLRELSSSPCRRSHSGASGS